MTDMLNQGPSGTPGEMQTKQGIWDRLLFGIPLLTGLFIAVNPFPHTTAISEISFYLTVALVLVLLLFKKITLTLQTPLTVPFGLFVAWSLFCLIFALNKTNSIHDIYAHLIKYLFMFMVLVNFFSSRQRFVSLVWTIIISSAVFGAWMMAHDYIILGRDISMKLGLQSFSEMPSNIVGIITVFALLLSLFRLKEEKNHWAKFLLVVCFGALTLSTLTTQTRGTLLALFIALVLSFPRNKKVGGVFSLFLVLAIVVLPVRDILGPNALKHKLMVDERLQIWHLYGEIIKTHPLVGIGFGMQTSADEHLLARYNAQLSPEDRPTQLYKAPHNLLVDITTRLGLPGLLVFALIMYRTLVMGIKTAARRKNDPLGDWCICLIAAFSAFLIQGMLENVLSGPPAVVLYTIMGMMTILWRLDREIPALA